MQRKNVLVTGLFVSVLCVMNAPTSWAEPEVGPIEATRTQTKKEAGKETSRWHFLKLTNVAPRIVAWWLDPAHNPEPLEVATAKNRLPRVAPKKADTFTNAAKPPQPKAENGGLEGNFGPLELLPMGIEAIIAADVSNELLVYGTDAGFEKIKAIVGFFDKPIPQIEVYEDEIATDEESAKLLGVIKDGDKFSALPQEPKEFQARLLRLSDAGKVKHLSNIRVTTMNNFPAVMTSSQQMPATKLKVEIGDQVLWNQVVGLAPGTEESAISFSQIRSFSVTPTLQNDGTMTLFLTWDNPVLLTSKINQQSVPLNAKTGLTTVMNVGADQTFLVNASVAPYDGKKELAAFPLRLFFVSARVRRR